MGFFLIDSLDWCMCLAVVHPSQFVTDQLHDEDFQIHCVSISLHIWDNVRLLEVIQTFDLDAERQWDWQIFQGWLTADPCCTARALSISAPLIIVQDRVVVANRLKLSCEKQLVNDGFCIVEPHWQHFSHIWTVFPHLKEKWKETIKNKTLARKVFLFFWLVLAKEAASTLLFSTGGEACPCTVIAFQLQLWLACVSIITFLVV